MRKYSLLKLMAILFCFFVVTGANDVHASSCTNKELNTLKQLANNIKFSYELYDDTYNEQHTYYFNILVTNFSKEFYFVDMDGRDFRYMSNLEVGGSRNLRMVEEGKMYTLEVYTSNETSCPNTKIVTKKIELPYYNDYSQREECEGIEEFSLCQKYYGGYIESEEYFLEQIEKYKNGDIEEIVEKQNIIDLILQFLLNNLIIIIPSIAVLVFAIVFIVIKVRKNKKKVKIKI
ncbi:MAG: hypothetical protein IJO43_01415 [Bacilli bacterium]|nr:hypothetical protein [Bacilli bacterium]